MNRIILGAMLQMRAAPEIGLASEHALRRIGLHLTEATEFFLRRMIMTWKIPFEIVAFDNATYMILANIGQQLRLLLGGRPESICSA